MKFFGFCLIATLFLPLPARALEPEQLVEILEGHPWGWPNVPQVCVEKTRTLSFNEDLTVMNNYVSEEVKDVTYNVLEFGPSSIIMEIEGEHRMTSGGQPVVWQLRLAGDKAFCWHRMDWPYWACTPFLTRCDG